MSVTIRCGTPAVRATACASDSASAVVGPGDLGEQPAAAGGQLRVAGDHAGDALVEPLAGDQSGAPAGRVRRPRHRPSSGSPAPPAPGPGRPRPGAPSRRARRRGCPRCRPGTGRSGGRSRAAGARRSSRTPGARSGRTRCGRCRGARRPGRGASTGGCGASVSVRLETTGDVDHGAVGQQHGQRLDVVDGAAVAQRPRAAGVVADHPADRAAGVRRRVGAEPQPGGTACCCSAACTTPGCTRAVRASRSSSSTRLRCRLVSTTMPGADRVAGDRGAGAAHRERRAGLPRHGQRGGDLVGVAAAAPRPAAGSGRGRRRWRRATSRARSRRRR